MHLDFPQPASQHYISRVSIRLLPIQPLVQRGILLCKTLKQRQPSKGHLCLDLENFQKKFCTALFQGISRRVFLGPYRNFPTLVNNFKSFKVKCGGLKCIFFLQFFIFVSWIDTLNRLYRVFFLLVLPKKLEYKKSTIFCLIWNWSSPFFL